MFRNALVKILLERLIQNQDETNSLLEEVNNNLKEIKYKLNNPNLKKM